MNITLEKTLGTEILSRNSVRRLIPLLVNECRTLDFHNISFISRSAADEFFNLIDAYPGTTLCNVNEEVQIMLDIVKRSRISNNRTLPKAKRSTTIICETKEDIRNALLSRQF